MIKIIDAEYLTDNLGFINENNSNNEDDIKNKVDGAKF